MNIYKNKFVLTEIKDANSTLKSPSAKRLVKFASTKKYNIKISYEGGETRCGNNIVKKETEIIDKTNKKHKYIKRSEHDICKQKIKDVFIIKNVDSNEYFNIGNSCIECFVLTGCISNINLKDFKYIKKLLSIKQLCIFCEKSCTPLGFHKNCKKGYGKKYRYTTSEDVKNYNDVVVQINIQTLVKKIKDLFSGVSFIRDCVLENRVNKKTLTSLHEFIKEHRFFINNKKKLLNYQNNRIINTVKKQRRKPSQKQKVFLDKLIVEYDRLILVDRENSDINYLNYGFIF